MGASTEVSNLNRPMDSTRGTNSALDEQQPIESINAGERPHIRGQSGQTSTLVSSMVEACLNCDLDTEILKRQGASFDYLRLSRTR